MRWEDVNWEELFPEETAAWKDFCSQAGMQAHIDNPVGFARYAKREKGVSHPRELEETWYLEPDPGKPRREDPPERREKTMHTYRSEYDSAFTKEDPRMTDEQVEAMVDEYFTLVGKKRSGK